MTSIRWALLFGVTPILFACGAATSRGSADQELEQDGGADPESTGGREQTGTGGGQPIGAGGREPGGAGGAYPGAGGMVPGTGGAVGGSSGFGGQACCLAAAVCNPGDTEIRGPEACPPGADCYQNAICCSSVWCARAPAQCRAYPTCDLGDREIQGACPPAYSCYQRELCGYVITCLNTLPDGGPAPIEPSVDAGTGSCDPSAEYNRDYIGSSPGECALIDFGCSSNTAYFANDCGCGCEQDPACPEWVDCMPRAFDEPAGIQAPVPPPPSSFCSPEGHARCPYTVRAY